MSGVIYQLKYVLTVCGLVLLSIVVLMALRTVFTHSRQITADRPRSVVSFDKSILIEHLSHALRFKTVSSKDKTKFEYSEFDKFFKYLEVTYPSLHVQLKKNVINNYSLLYEWEGRDLNSKPILLAAHMDVVPVSPETEDSWKYSAFSGTVADGYIWGRGAIDCKDSVIGICEAVEYLLDNGFQPERTVYLAFGHDEEVGGLEGASQIAAYLKYRGIEVEYILDEGGAVVDGILAGLEKPAAMIGTAEKGYLSLELKVKAEGGHSSTPPKVTAIGLLSRAITRIENNPFKTSLKGPAREMFEFLAPEMTGIFRFIFSNLWIFKGLVITSMKSSPSTAALLRTTSAVTVFESGIQDNVLPDSARAVVNLRILQGDNIKSVTEHVKKVIDDSRIQISTIGHMSEPSSVSSSNNKGFKILQKTIKQIFPESVVCPYLLLGASDSRHYSIISKNIYRFAPLHIHADDLKMNHGVNEKISSDNFEKMVEFYIQFLLAS